MDIQYSINTPISKEQFLDVLVNSGLSKRRPIHDLSCIQGMIENSNLVVSAWLEDRLIGIARSVTDFYYACYLSDLAIDERFQNRGIGKELQRLTKNELGPNCKLILIAAPAANGYYEKHGYQKNDHCWVLNAGSDLA